MSKTNTTSILENHPIGLRTVISDIRNGSERVPKANAYVILVGYFQILVSIVAVGVALIIYLVGLETLASESYSELVLLTTVLKNAMVHTAWGIATIGLSYGAFRILQELNSTQNYRLIMFLYVIAIAPGAATKGAIGYFTVTVGLIFGLVLLAYYSVRLLFAGVAWIVDSTSD